MTTFEMIQKVVAAAITWSDCTHEEKNCECRRSLALAVLKLKGATASETVS